MCTYSSHLPPPKLSSDTALAPARAATQDYLRTRRDAIRCIVGLLTADEEGEDNVVLEELEGEGEAGGAGVGWGMGVGRGARPVLSTVQLSSVFQQSSIKLNDPCGPCVLVCRSL